MDGADSDSARRVARGFLCHKGTKEPRNCLFLFATAVSASVIVPCAPRAPLLPVAARCCPESGAGAAFGEELQDEFVDGFVIRDLRADFPFTVNGLKH